EVGEDGGVLVRHRVADGVGDVDRGGPRLDGLLDDLGEEVELGARGVLRRELDVGAVGARPADALDGPAEDLVLGHVQLELAVYGAGGEEDVDARARGLGQGGPGAVDVGVVAARQAADYRAVDL